VRVARVLRLLGVIAVIPLTAGCFYVSGSSSPSPYEGRETPSTLTDLRPGDSVRVAQTLQGSVMVADGNAVTVTATTRVCPPHFTDPEYCGTRFDTLRVPIDTRDVEAYRGKRNFWRIGSVLGLAVGGVAGYHLGPKLGLGAGSGDDYLCPNGCPRANGVLLFGAAGSLLGAITGAILDSEWVRLEPGSSSLGAAAGQWDVGLVLPAGAGGQRTP